MKRSTQKVTNLDTLSSKQTATISAILQGYSISEVAARIGVSRQTIHKWQKNAEFRRQLSEARSERDESVRSIYLAMTHMALQVLRNALVDGDVKVALQFVKALNIDVTQDFGIGTGVKPISDEKIEEWKAMIRGEIPYPTIEIETRDDDDC